jgi:drug/metabolite transporter (DMT)-like permease
MDNPKIVRQKIFLAFLVIYFVWGSTYIAIRFAIETIPPALMAGLRFIISGLLLYGWSSQFDRISPRWKEIRKSIVVGLLLIVGGNGILVWSEQYIPSGLAALILAIIPIWMVLLEWIFVTGKRPAFATISGICIGVLGVGVLSGVDRNVLLENAREGGTVFFYAALLMLAALSWAGGSLYSRTIRSSASMLKLVSIQMLAGGLFLLLLATGLGEWREFALSALSLRSILSLVYLIIFGSVLTYSAYNWLLRQSSPAKVGTYAFFNPLVAVALGWMLADEPITARLLLGAVFILTAVVIVNRSSFFKIIPIRFKERA